VILGISASGRAVERNGQGGLLKGVTEDLVKFILDNTGEPSWPATGSWTRSRDTT
jgi:hypothetical protein